MADESKYEIVAHYDDDRILAEVWVAESGKVVTSPESFMKQLKAISTLHTPADGEYFIQELRMHYKSGYVSMRRKRD